MLRVTQLTSGRTRIQPHPVLPDSSSNFFLTPIPGEDTNTSQGALPSPRSLPPDSLPSLDPEVGREQVWDFILLGKDTRAETRWALCEGL